jgi:hypothetical protein
MDKPNRLKLLQLMEDKELSSKQVELLCNVTNQTVRIWRSRSGRDISDGQLQVLIDGVRK